MEGIKKPGIFSREGTKESLVFFSIVVFLFLKWKQICVEIDTDFEVFNIYFDNFLYPSTVSSKSYIHPTIRNYVLYDLCFSLRTDVMDR